jgi:hypothetical protein
MPAKPPKPGRPPKPPPNPDPNALGAAAAAAAAAGAAAAAAAAALLAFWKPIPIGLPTSGPNVPPNTVLIIPMATHSGAETISRSRLSSKPPTENPDAAKPPSPGKGVPVVAADELPPNAEDKGDARVRSAPVIDEFSCDSADCTPVPVDDPTD